MSNEIKVNFENLTEDERKELMRLVEKSNEPKRKVRFPERGEEYYYLESTNDVGYDLWTNNTSNNLRLNMGNIFKTKKEAEFAAEKQKVIVELQRYAIEHNERDIDWNDGNEHKYNIIYEHNFNRLRIFSTFNRQYIGQIYFTSVEIAKNAIREIGEDRIKKYLFGVEVGESEKY